MRIRTALEEKTDVPPLLIDRDWYLTIVYRHTFGDRSHSTDYLRVVLPPAL